MPHTSPDLRHLHVSYFPSPRVHQSLGASDATCLAMQSTANSPGSTSRELVWMSDPTSFETLSGRVRLACLTCRRKKQKCSGDVPCSTCVMSGGNCEGLVARKSRHSRKGSLVSSEPAEDATKDSWEPELLQCFNGTPGEARNHAQQRRQPAANQFASVRVDQHLHCPDWIAADSIWPSVSRHDSPNETLGIPNGAGLSQPYFGGNASSPESLDERRKAIDGEASLPPSRVGSIANAPDEMDYSNHVGGVRNLLSIAQNLEQQALELRQVAQARIEDLLKDLSGSEDM